MKSFVALIIFSLLTSCASLTENFIKEGKLQFNGGRYQEISWDSPLVFTRRSWYHELTLMFDLLYARVDDKSSYFRWFDDAAKEKVRSCDKFYVFLSYALNSADAGRISQGRVFGAIEEQGGEEVSTSQFSEYVELHPDVEQLSLQLYDISGYCFDETEDMPIVIDVPSYPRLELHL